MRDSFALTCPYCFETIDVYVDPETEGEMVEDCEVCCRPWRILVSRDEDGEATISVDRAQ